MDVSDFLYPLQSVVPSPHPNHLPNVVVVAYLIPCLLPLLPYLLYIYGLAWSLIRPINTIDECFVVHGQMTMCYPLDLWMVNRQMLTKTLRSPLISNTMVTPWHRDDKPSSR